VTRTEGKDQLRELLDVVVRSVQDPGISGADVAARAYLSRFHFDRLVAGATGEPPGALRRRLLLERAAHQLRHGDHPVTRVAMDAGYGSPEAFTHAFGRAFGLSPARFRAAARPPELPAPNGIHFHPPGGIRLPAQQRRYAVDVLNSMLEHDCWLIGELLDRAAALDAQQLSAPLVTGEADSTVLDLLTHLVWQKHRWVAAIEGNQAGEPDAASLDALRRAHAVSAPRFLRLTRDALAVGRVDDAFIDATCEPPQTFTIGGMIAHVLTFAAFERGLVMLALRQAGISDLGIGDPSGFVTRGGPPPEED
jgi:AraC family transcriptional regulator